MCNPGESVCAPTMRIPFPAIECAFFQAMIVPPDETKPLRRCSLVNPESNATWFIPLWRKIEEALSTT